MSKELTERMLAWELTLVACLVACNHHGAYYCARSRASRPFNTSGQFGMPGR
jgi:hypothetical protein